MNPLKVWKQIVLFVSLTLLFLLGVKTTTAAPSQTTLQAQNCSYGNKPRPFAQVVTETDPLTIRSSPDGPVIGLVPKGWQVVTGDRDATGQWVKIGGEYSPSPQNLDAGSRRRGWGFVSAPDFRVGWVNRAYLKPLGNFCEKPLKIQRRELQGLSQERQVLIHEDWLQIADRIASQNSQK
ncbi:hypothetical protein [Kamptonema sp. UHCC 0994]|uniref:hypothetical protein n=1 Tax=Kamptonema sp. UHCC 0994 TaxID=3031329 RepID=UPI0023BAE25C|nr:hypothetical protein [Kamptonema sp. UHCC 0994]MDF0556561.1 hypothetical protein [Kamptonema sp. UHCC 0994]